MSDDRHGIDRLRSLVEEVATTLEPPAPAAYGSRRGQLARIAAALGGIALITATGWWLFRGPGSAGALGIEVKHLRIEGREVDPRVFDARTAGTIVIAPAVRSERGGN